MYVEPGALDHEVVWAARHAGLRVRDVTVGALAKVLELDTPQHMVAVAAQRRSRVDDLVAASTAAPSTAARARKPLGPRQRRHVGARRRGGGLRRGAARGEHGRSAQPQDRASDRRRGVPVPVAEVDDLVGALLAPARAPASPRWPPPVEQRSPLRRQWTSPARVAVVIGNEAHGLAPEVIAAARSRSDPHGGAGGVAQRRGGRRGGPLRRRPATSGGGTGPDTRTEWPRDHHGGPQCRSPRHADTDAPGTGEFGDG